MAELACRGLRGMKEAAKFFQRLQRLARGLHRLASDFSGLPKTSKVSKRLQSLARGCKGSRRLHSLANGFIDLPKAA